MKKNCVRHCITLCAMIGLAFLAIGSGATAPATVAARTVKAYEMQTMPASGVLQGKTAVVFDLAMAEKVMPKRAIGTSGGGGLVGAGIAAAGNAADLKSFTNAATNPAWIEQENSAVIKKQPALYEAFSARYAELNGADTANLSFDFNGATPAADYFSKADADIKAKIAAACEENETDFAVTMVGQIIYAETMNAAPISVPTTLGIEVCLFDKNSTLISQGKVQTVSYLTRAASYITVLNLLLDDAIENTVLMIPALGGGGEKSGTKEYLPPSVTADRGDTRDAGPDETVLIVQRTDSVAGWPCTLVFNKGTDNERSVPIGAKTEVRLIIPNGENVMEAQVPVTGKNETNDPVTFTATGGQISYTLSVKGTVGAGNLKANQRFTWVKQ